MTQHKIEVYLDTYTSEPIVQTVIEELSINIGDVITKEDWLRLLAGTDSEIELKVKVEDVKHLYWDEETDYIHAMTVKVVPVDDE